MEPSISLLVDLWKLNKLEVDLAGFMKPSYTLKARNWRQREGDVQPI